MFKLVRTDYGIDQASNTTTLVIGVHKFGRGVFLDCEDIKVSHRHGQLNVCEDNKIILTALHKNPCFVMVKDSPALIVLGIGLTKELQEGDEFGLLPDAYWYRLTKNEDSSAASKERTEADEESLDSSSLFDTNVEKGQHSILETRAEIANIDSPSVSSTTKPTNLSADSVHNDEQIHLEMPMSKIPYHLHYGYTITTPGSQAPAPVVDCAIDNRDLDIDYDYARQHSGSLGEVVLQCSADGMEHMEVVYVEQCQTEGGTSGLRTPLHMEELSVLQPGVVPTSAAATEAAAAPAEILGIVPGGAWEQQRRNCDTLFDDSENDEFLDDNEIVGGVEELREQDFQEEDEDYPALVADLEEPADSEPFVWRDMTQFAARREAFTQTSGPTRPLLDPYSAFTAIWDEGIMKKIVEETNRHFVREIEREVRPEHSRTKYWQDTTVHEMYTFFAIILLMGITQMPSVECYFSLNYLLEHPAFGYIMSKHRYRLLTAFLHFMNNDDLQTYTGNEKLFELQSIMDHCNRKFKELYTPSQNIAIDESLTLWKGKLSWTQQNRSKATRFGIKTFELCESATGYLWSFIVYTGKETASAISSVVPKGPNKSVEIVLSLIEPLLNKGYTLWMNSWFNSPLLARYLKKRQTDCAGTLRANRKHVPKEITTEVEDGKLFGLSSASCAVFAWLDMRRVSLISTFHTGAMVEVRRTGRSVVTKPDIVNDYNLSISGIDNKKQMLQAYLVERKRGRRWYINFFKRLLNISVLNAKILYETSTNSKMTHLEFRLTLIDSILGRHLQFARLQGPPIPPQVSRIKRFGDKLPVNRTHPEDAHELVDVAPRKECVVCKRRGNRKQVHFKCNKCDVALCVTPCFNIFHNHADFDNFFSQGTKRRRKV